MILKNGWVMLYATTDLVVAFEGPVEHGKYAVWHLNPDGTTQNGEYFSAEDPKLGSAPEAFKMALRYFVRRMGRRKYLEAALAWYQGEDSGG